MAEKIGIETTTYVRNIFKYYVSYKLTQDAQATTREAEAAGRAGQAVTAGAPPAPGPSSPSPRKPAAASWARSRRHL